MTGNSSEVVHGSGDARANPYLLIAGAGSMVVATVGLFLRASPTLSGCFLFVGVALLVIAVFAPEYHQQRATTAMDIDLASIEEHPRETAAAEAQHY